MESRISHTRERISARHPSGANFEAATGIGNHGWFGTCY